MKKQELSGYNATFSPTGYGLFASAATDLAKIGNSMKIKITRDYVFLYATNQVKTYIMAMKSVDWPVGDIFETNEFPEKLNLVISAPREFAKAVGALNEKNTINATFKVRNDDNVRELSMNDGTTMVRFIGGLPTDISDLARTDIIEKMDTTKADFDFDITDEQYAKIKSFAAMSPVESVIIRIKAGKVSVSIDDKYVVRVADVAWGGDKTICFDKKYLKSIASKGGVKVHVFDFFILIVEENTRFMIGLEMDTL